MTQNPPQTNRDSLVGCLTLLLLPVLLALWQYTLLLIVFGVLGYGLFHAIKAYARLYREQDRDHAAWRLGTTVRAAGQPLVGRLCRHHEQYHLIDGFTSVTAPSDQASIQICTRRLHESAGVVSTVRGVLRFEPPPHWQRLRRSRRFTEFLVASGLELVEEFSVEGKAVRASLDCLEQADWAAAALRRLQGLQADVRATLAKARGNELLEPSIPQLQQALAAFEEQRDRLTQHIQISQRTSRKLFDYLAVPEGVRAIINFDLDALVDGSAFKDLEESFNEVVAINDAFRDLNRDRII